MKGKSKRSYVVGISVVLFVFTIADIFNSDDYTCERIALETIAQSPDKTVALEGDCTVMEWIPFRDPKISELNGELFQYWNVTKDKKTYYNKNIGLD